MSLSRLVTLLALLAALCALLTPSILALRVEDDEEEDAQLVEPADPADPAADAPPAPEVNDDGDALTQPLDEDDEITVEDVPDDPSPPTPHSTPSPYTRKMKPYSRSAQSSKATSVDPSYMHPDDIFKMEILLASVCIVYAIVFIRGRSQNKACAAKFKDAMISECTSQFSFLGPYSFKRGATSQTARPGDLQQLGYGTFVWYATGRRYIRSLTATLEQRRRFDLFYLLLGTVIKTDPDVVTVVCPFSVDIEPIIACLMLRREVRSMVEKYDDLATYCETVPKFDVPEKFMVVANVPEIAAAVFSEPVRKAIWELEDTLLAIHVTTEGIPDSTAGKAKNVLEVVFKLPRDNAERLALVVRMMFYLVDLIGRTKLSREAREGAARVRRKVEEIDFRRKDAERQEAAQNRRLEKEKKREEEIAGMSRDAQIKYRQQKEKKAQRKKVGGGREGVRRVLF